MLNKKVKEMNRWFEKTHEECVRKHEKSDGIIAKMIEAYMGAIDRAWVQFKLIFEDELNEKD